MYGRGGGGGQFKKETQNILCIQSRYKKLQVLHLKNLFFIGRRQFENKVLNKKIFLTQTYHNREEKYVLRTAKININR